MREQSRSIARYWLHSLLSTYAASPAMLSTFGGIKSFVGSIASTRPLNPFQTCMASLNQKWWCRRRLLIRRLISTSKMHLLSRMHFFRVLIIRATHVWYRLIECGPTGSKVSRIIIHHDADKSSKPVSALHPDRSLFLISFPPNQLQCAPKAHPCLTSDL